MPRPLSHTLQRGHGKGKPVATVQLVQATARHAQRAYAKERGTLLEVKALAEETDLKLVSEG